MKVLKYYKTIFNQQVTIKNDKGVRQFLFLCLRVCNNKKVGNCYTKDVLQNTYLRTASFVQPIHHSPHVANGFFFKNSK